MIRVAAVGPTPPPIGGQAVMLEALLRARLVHAELLHVRTAFARDMSDMGRLRLAKVLKVLPVLAGLLRARARGARVLYFTPSGPSRLAFWRDAALLLAGRRLFPQTVLHFHAAGLADLAERLTGPERALLHLAFGRPDLAILTSGLNPPDDRVVSALRTAIVPCGIEDVAERHRGPSPGRRPVLLYVGVLRESKGTALLLEAAHWLTEQGHDFELVLAGQWHHDRFRRAMERRVSSSALAGRVRFAGVLTGEAKWEAYAHASIFCYPTHFEAESFGLVLLEAMSFSLPIVATTWRGVPDVVKEGTTGFLVPIRDATALADRIGRLLADPELRHRLGAAGRARFLSNFTLERHLHSIDQLLGGLDSKELRP